MALRHLYRHCTMATAIQLIDTRAEFKVANFSGEDSEWHQWSVKSRSYFALLNWEDLITAAEAETAVIPMSVLGPQAAAVAKQLHAWLISRCGGKALSLVLQSPNYNGLESWRRLCAEYEPHIGGRFAAMLRSLLNPKWADEMRTGKSFQQCIIDWENSQARCTQQSGKTLDSDIQIATLLEHSPEPFLGIMRGAPQSTRENYQTLRSHVFEWIRAGSTYAVDGSLLTSTSAPMDVGAVQPYKGDKGKKGDGKKGKDYGKKGDKNDYKGSKNYGKWDKD